MHNEIKIGETTTFKNEILLVENFWNNVIMKGLYENTFDEIFLVDDLSSDGTFQFLEQHIMDLPDELRKKISLESKTFGGNWSDHKNYLADQIFSDWVFNIDCDEILEGGLFRIKEVIELNPTVDIFGIPRINLLEGDSLEIQRYVNYCGWKMNGQGRVNYPDFQWNRLFKKGKNLHLRGTVHEILDGDGTQEIIRAPLPVDNIYHLIHKKSLQKQIQQNNGYAELQR
jgi:glycosyltransferase involved in cell wall biosynthesis